MVQRKWLIKALRKEAKAQGIQVRERQGGNHEIFYLDNLRIPIPRHNELEKPTAQLIIKEASAKLGKDWLK
ncbi:type II toxin-antitoxin system HicA family toxin [Bifidobacterium sp. ESL0728]|uniref:type II toxin-antitoxin system HicA family toxin n=1 Tax=Bifidobacterium sp. ESL0728 TaxID=2983220 RepID=UPI0023F7B689|nr:type II toxin-antitoxin system HicA family toxin [Bifidobacterium sp. ESL0728]WEV58667.1 type II toxin-antitoxin system HicA family toxin [Bifidobacterium sp. ESL0728]